MKYTTRKLAISGAVSLTVLLAIFAVTSHKALASGNGCPSATVYYQNGYSSNYCVPSYYPGYPQTPSYYGGVGNGYSGGSNNGSNNGYYYPTQNYYQSPYLPQNNPFQTPVYNQPFYPYNPVPTYYYPPTNTNRWHY